jgi:hypothetical protein
VVPDLPSVHMVQDAIPAALSCRFPSRDDAMDKKPSVVFRRVALASSALVLAFSLSAAITAALAPSSPTIGRIPTSPPPLPHGPNERVSFVMSGFSWFPPPTLGIQTHANGVSADPPGTEAVESMPSDSEVWFQYTGQYLGRLLSMRTGMNVVSGDMDNDGDYDLVIGSQENGSIIQVYLNDGNGVFTNSGRSFQYREDDEDCTDRGTGDPPGRSQNFGIALGDFNGDGFLDIATADGCGGVNIYLTTLRNPGSQQTGVQYDDVQYEWSQRLYQHEWWEVKGITTDDLDNDGDADLVFGIHNGYPRGLKAYANDGTGLFYPLRGSFVPAITWSIRACDVDANGEPDLVAVYRYGESPSHVYYNNDGSFERRLDLEGTSTDDSYDVKCGDIDLDGMPDLAVAESEHTDPGSGRIIRAKIFANNGDGTFAVVRDDLGCSDCEPKSLELVDLNSDGWTDILFGNYNHGNYIYLNDGAGAFPSPSPATDGLEAMSTLASAVSDINNDGYVDLITGGCPSSGFGDGTDHCGYRVYVKRSASFSGNRDPSPPSGLRMEVQGARVVFSWDSGFDSETPQIGLTYNLRIGRTPGGNEILSGTIPFGPGNTGHAFRKILRGLPTGVYYWSVQTVDTGYRRSAWPPERSFSFVSPDSTPPAPATVYASMGFSAGQVSLAWIAPGDDGDTGTADHYVLKYSTSPIITEADWISAQRSLSVPSPSPAGNWESTTVPGLLPGQRYYFGLKTVDVSGNVSLLSNSPSARAGIEGDLLAPATPCQPSAANNGVRVILADLHGDGDLDLIEGNGEEIGQPTYICFNDGHGNFAVSQVLPAIHLRDMAVGDIDGDGDLDLVTCGNEGTTIWINDGTGTFATELAFVGPAAVAIKLADLDGDGDLDFLLQMLESGGTRVLFNDGRGHFTDSGQVLGGQRTNALAMGDVDGDGDIDLVRGNYSSGDGPIGNRLFLNDGRGRLADSGQTLGNSNTVDVRLVDMDGDGDLDLVAGNSLGDENEIYLDDGHGNFGPPLRFGQSGNETKGLGIGDLDNDGDLDIVTADWNGGARVYFNYGPGHLSASGNALGPNQTIFPALGDVDGDGDLDLVSAVRGSPNVLFLNSVSTYNPNTPPQPPSSTQATVAGSTVTVSWSAGQDQETPPVLLTYNLRVGRTPGGNEVVSAVIPAGLGNMGHAFSKVIRALPPGTFYWSVQTIDSGFAGSAFMPERTFTIEPPGGTGFYTVTPCRVVDTRNAAGPAGGPALVAGAIRSFPVTGGVCGIPSTAVAVSVNLTVTQPAAQGYLTLYPGDAVGPPLVSNINFTPGVTRANNAVVPLAGDGSGTIKVKNGSAGTVHFVLDVNGFFQ